MSSRLRVLCSSCGRSLSVDAERAGKKLRCPDCQTILTVPTNSARTTAGSSSASRRSGGRQSSGEDFDEDEEVPAARSSRRKGKVKREDPEDIWSQPLSSYSSPAIEEHEYEQFGIEPKRPKIQEQTDNNGMTLKGPMVFFVIGVLAGIVAVGMTFVAPEAGRIAGFVVIALGSLLSLIGHWKIRETAFEESTLCGAMYMWMPFYQPYYILSRFTYVKVPFLVSILGNIVLFIGVLAWVLADLRLEKAAGG